MALDVMITFTPRSACAWCRIAASLRYCSWAAPGNPSVPTTLPISSGSERQVVITSAEGSASRLVPAIRGGVAGSYRLTGASGGRDSATCAIGAGPRAGVRAIGAAGGRAAAGRCTAGRAAGGGTATGAGGGTAAAGTTAAGAGAGGGGSLIWLARRSASANRVMSVVPVRGGRIHRRHVRGHGPHVVRTVTEVEIAAHLEHHLPVDRAVVEGEPGHQRVVGDDADGARDAARPLMNHRDRVVGEDTIRPAGNPHPLGDVGRGLRQAE